MSADNPRITEQPEQQADKHITSQLNNAVRACTIHLPRHPSLAPDIVQKNYAVTYHWHQPLDNRFAPSLASITRLCTTDLPRHPPLAPCSVQKKLRRHSPTAPQPAPSICLAIHCRHKPLYDRHIRSLGNTAC